MTGFHQTIATVGNEIANDTANWVVPLLELLLPHKTKSPHGQKVAELPSLDVVDPT